MDKIVKVAEEFYRDLYSSGHKQDDNLRRISLETPEEVKKSLDAIKRGKAVCGDNSRSFEGRWADSPRKTGHPLYAMPRDLEGAVIMEEC